MMGAGKSTIGRRLSVRLAAAVPRRRYRNRGGGRGLSIPDIFESHGEPHFQGR